MPHPSPSKQKNNFVYNAAIILFHPRSAGVLQKPAPIPPAGFGSPQPTRRTFFILTPSLGPSPLSGAAAIQYFIPDIRLSQELPPQTSFQEKLGGIPWGLPQNAWPKCAACGKSQSLLAQFLHHPERLNLGKTGRVLSIFQCNHDPGSCSTWQAQSGSNACIISEPQELLPTSSSLPPDAPEVELEVRIVAWVQHDDGIPQTLATSFFDDSSYINLPEEQILASTMSTKLGSVPHWIQSADEAPKDGWRFLGQLDSTYSFLQAPKSPHPHVHPDTENYEGRTHFAQGPNFGDGGIAYLFLKINANPPQALIFWQCG